jgi:hypothetical protein
MSGEKLPFVGREEEVMAVAVAVAMTAAAVVYDVGGWVGVCTDGRVPGRPCG